MNAASFPGFPEHAGGREHEDPAGQGDCESDGLEGVCANQLKTWRLLVDSPDIPRAMRDVLSDRTRAHERDLKKIRTILANLRLRNPPGLKEAVPRTSPGRAAKSPDKDGGRRDLGPRERIAWGKSLQRRRP